MYYFTIIEIIQVIFTFSDINNIMPRWQYFICFLSIVVWHYFCVQYFTVRTRVVKIIVDDIIVLTGGTFNYCTWYFTCIMPISSRIPHMEGLKNVWYFLFISREFLKPETLIKLWVLYYIDMSPGKFSAWVHKMTDCMNDTQGIRGKISKIGRTVINVLMLFLFIF